jgi:hypothetical protein
MQTKRKIQLGALAVIANGLLSLSLLNPTTAFAGTCQTFQGCLQACPSNIIAECELIEPGCTATSASSCFAGAGPLCPGNKVIICDYT